MLIVLQMEEEHRQIRKLEVSIALHEDMIRDHSATVTCAFPNPRYPYRALLIWQFR
jgi:hypothetical protein